MHLQMAFRDAGVEIVRSSRDEPSIAVRPPLDAVAKPEHVIRTLLHVRENESARRCSVAVEVEDRRRSYTPVYRRCNEHAHLVDQSRGEHATVDPAAALEHERLHAETTTDLLHRQPEIHGLP